MMKELTFSALFLALISVVLAVSKEERHRGFNEDVEWETLDDAKTKAAAQNKPIFLLIHKSWCGACKALKPQLVNSKEFAEFSKNFVMVNVEDEEEPNDKSYAPDGGYIPRILFMKPNGEIIKKVINAGGNASYKYYYSNAQDIMTSMKSVMEEMKGTVSDEL